MSVLTKVFVVLLTVFSIALSMLVVAAFAKQEDWRQSSIQFQESFNAEQARARALSAQLAIEQQSALDRHREDVRTINNLRDEQITQQTQISDLERRRAEAQNQLTVEQGQVTGLTEENKLLLAAVNRSEETGARLARRNSELERRNIDLNDRVKELTSDMTMAISQIRALKQQIVAVGESQGATTGLFSHQAAGVVEAHMPSVQAPAMPTVLAEIRGKITSIAGNLASVSVGNADGVAPGMVFLIYRPGKGAGRPLYLGSLRITKVEANESAGLVEQSVGDIRPGDLARDELSLAMGG